MAESIELSIEETNKLRAQIGLPLIPTGKAADQTRVGDGLNVQSINSAHESSSTTSVPDKHINKQMQNRVSDGTNQEKEKEKEIQSTVARSKPPRVTFHYDDVDTGSWLDSLGGPKTQEKVSQIADSKPVESEVSSCTTVKHSAKQLASLADGEIFTLADTDVLGDSGDELVNETLSKEAKLVHDQKERKKEGFLKFGKPRPSGESEDEESEDPESGITVMEGSTISLAQNQGEPQEKIDENFTGHTLKLEGLFEDLEPPKAAVSIKKLKAKKSKSASKKRKRDDELIDPVEPMYTAKLGDEDDNLEDDFENILSRVRVKNNKTRRLMTAEEIADEVKSHKRVDMATEVETGFVYDDTKDFLDTIGTTVVESPNPVSVSSTLVSVKPDASATQDQHDASPEESKPKEESLTLPDSEIETKTQTQELMERTQSNEPNLNSISSTLKYLRSQTDVLDSEKSRKSKIDRERQKEAELAKIQINIEERLIRDQMNKDPSFLKMKPEEQEKVIDRRLNDSLVQKGIVVESNKQGGRYSRYSGPADPLKDYSPQVNVEYKDARGNKLNKKQAWKELSHRYHGSAPKHKKEVVSRRSTEEKVIH